MALNIYLVRHGKTVWNIEGRLQGSGDSPLLEEGIEGAKQAGRTLKAVPFAAAYSSMQKRAQDTANYLLAENQQPNIPHFHHAGLNEMGFGRWEKMKSVDLYDNDEYWLMKRTPAEYKALQSGGETYEQVYQRAMQALTEIAEKHKDDENVLIVAHGMTLTILTAVLRGLPWFDCRDESKHSFVMNTAINRAVFENGKIRLVEFNNIDHMNP